MSPIWLIALFHGVNALSGYDCTKHGEKIIYRQGDQHNCSTYANVDYAEFPWDGTILQTPLKVIQSHRTCNLILRTYTMYSTYSRNPTQLELMNDDISLTPYKLTGAECEKAWKYHSFACKGVTIQVRFS